MKNILIAGSVLFLGWLFFIREESVTYGPGVMVDEAPIQESVSGEPSFPFKGYNVTPLASIQLKAKVLSKEEYSADRESELAPFDLALGWKEMSDEAVLSSIDISQSNRWYRWRSDNLPIPRRKVEVNSANMHLIPANESITMALNDVRKGDLVELSGKLVKVNAQDGWRWVSSLTRNDTGNGACELIYVDSFRIRNL